MSPFSKLRHLRRHLRVPHALLAVKTLDHLDRGPYVGSKLIHADALRIMRRLSIFRREYFLNTDLVNQVLSAQVRQMRPFLVIR
jgi:hypothetical protein